MRLSSTETGVSKASISYFYYLLSDTPILLCVLTLLMGLYSILVCAPIPKSIFQKGVCLSSTGKKYGLNRKAEIKEDNKRII